MSHGLRGPNAASRARTASIDSARDRIRHASRSRSPETSTRARSTRAMRASMASSSSASRRRASTAGPCARRGSRSEAIAGSSDGRRRRGRRASVRVCAVAPSSRPDARPSTRCRASRSPPPADRSRRAQRPQCLRARAQPRRERAAPPPRGRARARRVADRARADAPAPARQTPARRHEPFVTRIAFASGFQSLRRFNAAFRAQYRMPPSALVRASHSASAGEFVRLTLAYRAPFAWRELLRGARRAMRSPASRSSTARVTGARSASASRAACSSRKTTRRARACSTHGRRSTCRSRAEEARAITSTLTSRRRSCPRSCRCSRGCGSCSISTRIRRRSTDISRKADCDAHVARTPGIRIPGAIDGFDIAVRAILRGRCSRPPLRRHRRARDASDRRAARHGHRTTHASAPHGRAHRGGGERPPSRARRAAAQADATVAVARLVASGELKLEPGSDVIATRHALMDVAGIGDQIASYIVMRTLSWPDAFPFACHTMARVVGAPNALAFRTLSQRWRPWRAYAAMQLVQSSSA